MGEVLLLFLGADHLKKTKKGTDSISTNALEGMKVVDITERIYLNKIYSNIYIKILNITEINIYDKWSCRGIKNLYRSNTHMISHWVKISMNLFLLTNNEKYLPIITDF